MDNEKLKFFEQRYNDMDDGELHEVLGRRADLAEEAVVAVEKIAQVRGINLQSITPSGDTLTAIPADNEAQSQQLFKSPAKHKMVSAFALVLGGPIMTLDIGALPILLAGSVGALIGHKSAKSICAAPDVPYPIKAKQLKQGFWAAIFAWIFFTTIISVIGRP